MPATTIDIIIPAGESLSNAIDVIGTPLVLLTPPEWTPANLSFQISIDNATFYNMTFIHIHELMLVTCKPGQAMILDQRQWPRGEVWLKLRSGSVDDPVVQEAERVFTLVTE